MGAGQRTLAVYIIVAVVLIQTGCDSQGEQPKPTHNIKQKTAQYHDGDSVVYLRA